MRWQSLALSCLIAFSFSRVALAQQEPASSGSSAPKQSAKKTPPAQGAPPPSSTPDTPNAEPPPTAPDPDTELQAVVQQAGSDHATLIKNLEAYLVRHPDSPRRGPIYRALMESEMQLHNEKSALDYAEKAVAVQPDDIQTMYTAITILEKMPDDASQLHAIDYDTRLIEQVAKANPDTRPERMTLDDWQSGRTKFTTELYILRGQINRHLHKDDDAVKDFTSSFRLSPNPEAALDLGEIAEQQKHVDEAVREYALAFILSGDTKDDPAMNRDSLRMRMENLWRFTHDSNAGLGDVLLGAYDKNTELTKASRLDLPDAPVYNKGITDPLQFSLRQVDGKDAVQLPSLRGKVVVLNFWTTWCEYCHTMESLLSVVHAKFAGHDDVVYLAVNADEDGALVEPFLKEQKLSGTVVFADGLDAAFQVQSIPTIIVLGRAGKIAYRTQGYAPDGFVDAISDAITKSTVGK